jgi:hypothetical protein
MNVQAIQNLGCDPELFLINPKTGEFVSSIDKIGGSKDFPRPIGEGCAIQEDNVAVEFNTPPCPSADAFVASIQHNLNVLTNMAGEMGLELCIKPSAIFPKKELEDPRAQEFGCEPDYNAWKEGARNPRPRAKNKQLRSAGGHIHVQTDLDKCTVIKAMDLFVGCPMLDFDDDVDRRKLYGGAGAFRPKVYGVEYRTASNAWITSPDRIRWVWNQTDKALKFVQEGRVISEEDGELIQRCINESDLGLLAQLRDKYPEIDE